LNPIQAHYQAVLRPDVSRNAKDANVRGLCNRKGVLSSQFAVHRSQFAVRSSQFAVSVRPVFKQ
jgi:hypothetical protein